MPKVSTIIVTIVLVLPRGCPSNLMISIKLYVRLSIK